MASESYNTLDEFVQMVFGDSNEYSLIWQACQFGAEIRSIPVELLYSGVWLMVLKLLKLIIMNPMHKRILNGITDRQANSFIYLCLFLMIINRIIEILSRYF